MMRGVEGAGPKRAWGHWQCGLCALCVFGNLQKGKSGWAAGGSRLSREPQKRSYRRPRRGIVRAARLDAPKGQSGRKMPRGQHYNRLPRRGRAEGKIGPEIFPIHKPPPRQTTPLLCRWRPIRLRSSRVQIHPGTIRYRKDPQTCPVPALPPFSQPHRPPWARVFEAGRRAHLHAAMLHPS